jgi:hypothetical protein
MPSACSAIEEVQDITAARVHSATGACACVVIRCISTNEATVPLSTRYTRNPKPKISELGAIQLHIGITPANTFTIRIEPGPIELLLAAPLTHTVVLVSMVMALELPPVLTHDAYPTSWYSGLSKFYGRDAGSPCARHIRLSELSAQGSHPPARSPICPVGKALAADSNSIDGRSGSHPAMIVVLLKV